VSARESAMASDVPFRARTVRCPGCGGDAVYAPSNPSRPFCSPRCRNNDFGAWASEAYGVVATPKDEDEDPDAEPIT
jgi:endogenous inhibitor of DNA gyrase (YacG/DUF329 family)